MMIDGGAGAPTFAGRMRTYFGEMLPLPQHVALASLIYLHIAVFARHIHELSTPIVSVHGAIGAASLFGLMVILRLMDELKDEDIDRQLFPDRPLPSGRVLRTDVHLALLGTALLYLAVNLWTGWAYFVAAAVLGYGFLMFRRFFAPDALRRSLPLTLATHNPIVALMILYGFAVFAAEHDLSPVELQWNRITPFLVMTWSPFLAWELARKIRSEDEENEYVTYSRLLGRRGAVLVTWLVQAVGVALGIYLWRMRDLPAVAVVVILAGFVVNLWAGLRFLRHPHPSTSHLQPFATFFLLTVLVSQLVSVAAAEGAR
jgi:4-hydroxybenzoate polyprenyltransferase